MLHVEIASRGFVVDVPKTRRRQKIAMTAEDFVCIIARDNSAQIVVFCTGWSGKPYDGIVPTFTKFQKISRLVGIEDRLLRTSI